MNKTIIETHKIDKDTPSRIRAAMTVVKINQTDLAEQIGVTRAAVSAWLNRDPDKRSAISPAALEKMSGVLLVSPDWIDGTSDAGGITEMEFNALEEIDNLPSKEWFLKLVKRIVDENSSSDGFEDPSMGYMDDTLTVHTIDFDYVDDRMVMNVDISKKTTRTIESLTELAWPLFMAKRIDEINNTKKTKRRYQLLLINPPLLNQVAYEGFAYQARMMGVMVSIRNTADEIEISNLVIDPFFQDEERWPKSVIEAKEKFFNKR
jgi:transcriptional regulator with XRE-family HTH domain